MHTTRVWQQKCVQETSAAHIALQFRSIIFMLSDQQVSYHKHHWYSMSSCWLQIDIWLDVDWTVISNQVIPA